MDAFRKSVEDGYNRKIPAPVVRALDCWVALTKQAWQMTDTLGNEKADLAKKLKRAEKMRDDTFRQFGVQAEEKSRAVEEYEKVMKSNRLLQQAPAHLSRATRHQHARRSALCPQRLSSPSRTRPRRPRSPSVPAGAAPPHQDEGQGGRGAKGGHVPEISWLGVAQGAGAWWRRQAEARGAGARRRLVIPRGAARRRRRRRRRRR